MKTNDVGDAKQEVATNLCTIDDVDITEKGVHEVSSVDDNGQVLEHMEVELLIQREWLGRDKTRTME